MDKLINNERNLIKGKSSAKIILKEERPTVKIDFNLSTNYDLKLTLSNIKKEISSSRDFNYELNKFTSFSVNKDSFSELIIYNKSDKDLELTPNISYFTNSLEYAPVDSLNKNYIDYSWDKRY